MDGRGDGQYIHGSAQEKIGTAGFRRNGFYFESGTLSFESSDMIFPLMKEIGVYDRVGFVRQKMGLITGEMTYRELKEGVKQALIAKASAVIPGLAGRVEFSDLATPRTYERYTGNTDGATSAWSWNPKNKFYKNIMSIRIATPVRKLLVGSCWSCQIAGVPSAVSAARKCAQKIG